MTGEVNQMAVKASPEAIREMKREISNTIKDIEKISNGIKTGMSATSSWDDAKAAQFNSLMQRIARLTEGPIDTLNAALPKLEKLAQSLDEYNRVNF
jgi:predicted phage tail protein